MKHLLSILLFLFTTFTAQAQSSVQAETEALFDRFKAAARFDYKYPREKVYLHFDNAGYLEGDTIWYKAYVVRASSLKPTTLSRVLYVELLNADGQQMEQQILHLDSIGTADGAFALTMPIHAGFYEIRAYTREMTNWGEAACFSRVMPVFTGKNPQRELEKGLNNDVTQLSIPQPDANKEVNALNPRPYTMKKPSERLLDFYPEGGNRASGLAQRIAFKVTDGRGMPLEDVIHIYDNQDHLITSAAPEHEGMGDFLLPADFKDGYAVIEANESGTERDSSRIAKKRFPLPEATSQYVLQADVEADGLYVKVSANAEAVRANRLLGLAVFNRENACYFDTLTVGEEPIELLVEKKNLRGGVNRLVLFDDQGTELANRMFWSPLTEIDSMRNAVVEVRQNAVEYDAFAPIVINIKAHDHQGKPIVGASLSVSVRDEQANILSSNDGGMAADFLLSSEVRGYIHRPDLYFVRDDAQHRRMLDLLLRVQGWSANTFEVMCGKDSFAVWQPIEEKLILRGTVYRDNNKQKPWPGIKLGMKAYRYEEGNMMAGAIEGDAVTDANGKFAFESNVNYEGDYIAQFVMRDGEKDKKRWSRLGLDRWFSPAPRPYQAKELALTLYNRPEDVDFDKPIETFQWTDTIPRAIFSIKGVAEVVRRKRYKGFTGNRYTWMGGENAGMEKTSKFINLQREYERMKDRGELTKLELGFFLKKLDDNFEFDRRANNDTIDDVDKNGFTYGIRYNGHPVKVYQNNVLVPTFLDKIISSDLSIGDQSIENFKSATFDKSNLRTNAFSGKEYRSNQEQYSLYVYDLPQFYRTVGKKGVEYRNIEGFRPKTKKIYSPNYRKFDVPDEGDTRRTLLWTPATKTDKKGEANLIIFNNARKKATIDISVRGITDKGILLNFDSYSAKQK